MSVGLAALPSSKLTLCGVEPSAKTHVTWPPAAIVTLAGLKAIPSTLTVALVWAACAVAGSVAVPGGVVAEWAVGELEHAASARRPAMTTATRGYPVLGLMVNEQLCEIP